MQVTRRSFISHVAQAGGYGAAFSTMQALGLLPMQAIQAQAVRPVPGHGTRVVVLGASVRAWPR